MHKFSSLIDNNQINVLGQTGQLTTSNRGDNKINLNLNNLSMVNDNQFANRLFSFKPGFLQKREMNRSNMDGGTLQQVNLPYKGVSEKRDIKTSQVAVRTKLGLTDHESKPRHRNYHFETKSPSIQNSIGSPRNRDQYSIMGSSKYSHLRPMNSS